MLIAATGATVTAGTLGAGMACACSCAPLDPQELIEGNTVAVGRVLEVDEEPTGGRYLMAVEHSYGSELPSYIIVNTASPAGACGFFPPLDELVAIVLGARSGPALDIAEGEYSASLCENLGVDVESAARYGGHLYEPTPVARPSLTAQTAAPDGSAGWFDRSRIILIASLGGVAISVAAAAGIGMLRRRRSD